MSPAPYGSSQFSSILTHFCQFPSVHSHSSYAYNPQCLFLGQRSPWPSIILLSCLQGGATCRSQTLSKLAHQKLNPLWLLCSDSRFCGWSHQVIVLFLWVWVGLGLAFGLGVLAFGVLELFCWVFVFCFVLVWFWPEIRARTPYLSLLGSDYWMINKWNKTQIK